MIHTWEVSNLFCSAISTCSLSQLRQLVVVETAAKRLNIIQLTKCVVYICAQHVPAALTAVEDDTEEEDTS